jgi:hypothetical protein
VDALLLGSLAQRGASLAITAELGPIHDIGISFMARGDFEQSAARKLSRELRPEWVRR